MKRKLLAAVILIALYLVTAAFSFDSPQLNADNSEAEKDLGENVEEIVDNLDLAELEAYLAQLAESQKAVIGFGSIKNRIKAVINGNLSHSPKVVSLQQNPRKLFKTSFTAK